MERTPQNSPRPYYREMTALGARLGLLVYAFAPRDVDWQRGVVRGFRALHPHGSWDRGPFPLPSVLYDQTKSRALAALPACVELKRRLARRGTIMLGPGFLSKSQVSTLLREAPELQEHLPETSPATPRNVAALLGRHPTVFIKHARGTLGFNVVRVRRLSGGGYLWEVARGYRRTTRLRLPTSASLSRRVAIAASRGGWLAQQGIDLCKYQGRAADIRLLMQKDERGKWQLTVGFAKVAAPGQVVTNIGAGGSLHRLDDLLRHAARRHGWQADAAELTERLLAVGLLTAKALDRAIGPLAELGIDLGLDAHGKVWLIEANGKYSRAVFSRATRQQSIRRVLGYSRFLYLQRRQSGRGQQAGRSSEGDTANTADLAQVVELVGTAE